MKFGLLTSILDGWSFEEAVDIAAQQGFQCLEVACWPFGTAERRYAGVSHIDCGRVCADKAYADFILKYAADRHIEISALAYYPNVMDGDLEKRAVCIAHLKQVIRAAAILKVNLVTTFVGRDQNKSIEENLDLFMEIWPQLIGFAESQGVRIAIENCPMLFGRDQWPGGQNLMCTPVIFRELFQRIPSPSFGLNFDPSHYVWQGMDYVRSIYEFKDRIFHIHFKDIRVNSRKLAECGVLAYPLDYMEPKLPGLGDVDWSAFISALYDIDFRNCAVIEVEDRAFEGSKEEILKSIALSKRFLSQYL